MFKLLTQRMIRYYESG